ncbi:MAG: sigma-70 family RNA polymerase sigma factor [Rikenellaceae bacterium]|jgi:RNA polymerase sigma-70 factor (ECF subfamily)|nr:sigma-70 family RNA polymerase sigma factor [Rikenellaceae bacterium]
MELELANYHNLSDQQLVEKALENDSSAFEQLFMRYKKDLLQLYVQRTGNNPSDASDILQETFIKVYLNLHRYNPAYPFTQWLHAIARNTFIDYTRKRKDNILSIDSQNWNSARLNPAANTANPEEKMMQRQTGKELDRLLEKMPAHYKQMIIMRFVQEYSYEEIAEKLTMPIGTVKTQIHRAREKFYQLISNADSIL